VILLWRPFFGPPEEGGSSIKGNRDDEMHFS